jgi:glyoxylase-like metal-dependent hydrolase (beta-lactamase superfamily II)
VKVLAVSHDKGCRSYVIVDPASGDGCVVDPLLDRLGEVQRLLSEERATLKWIVDTHSHGDHLSGAAALRERTGAEVVMHPAAKSDVATVRPPDGERLEFGETGLRVWHAPGVTPDAIVLEAPGALFTGDTLLIGTVGLRDAPGSDPDQWYATFRRVFDPRPPETVIHPGHDDMGRTLTTLRRERTGNGWLRQDDLEAFKAQWRADARPVRHDADVLLDANRTGLQRVPREIEAASGFTAPAARAEQAATEGAFWQKAEAPAPAAPRDDGHRALLQIAGAAAVLGTLLGWGVHPALHGLSGLAGAILLAVGIVHRGPKRRGKPGSSLYYEGPVRRTLGT